VSNELTEAELAIHVAICEDSPQHCNEWRGRCVKATEAVAPIIKRETLAKFGDRMGQFNP